MTKSKFTQFFLKPGVLLWFYIIVTVIASLHRVFFVHDLALGPINNYLIYKFSFWNLIHGENLYVLHPEQHYDYFKYSPAFAFLFAPFAVLPDWLGVTLWNLLNSISLLIAVRLLPIEEEKKSIILWVIFIELLTSVQNIQSNGLLAALLVFAFVGLEKEKFFLSALCIAFSGFIKIFGVAALILLLFYSKQGIKFIFYFLLCTAVLFFLPMTVTGWEQLKFLYNEWNHLLQEDRSASWGLSVMGILKTWFNPEYSGFPKTLVQIIGGILLCLPLIRFSLWKEIRFRILFLSSLLIWLIIFNHRAESPTFVIAVAGAAIWFVMAEKTWLNIFLLCLMLFLTSLSPTDLFPSELRRHFVVPYMLKALPCVLVWARIEYELLKMKPPAADSSS